MRPDGLGGVDKACRVETRIDGSPRIVNAAGTGLEPLSYKQEAGEGLKPTNPKDAIGSDKIPYHLWPETATLMGALGMLDGALKYGRANWRAGGIRASIYFDALRRHVNKMWEGEDIDPDSGLPHECHALACLAILIDAKAAGVLNDDRAYPGGYTKLLDEMTPHVRRLKDKHADKNPHHYTVRDKVSK